MRAHPGCGARQALLEADGLLHRMCRCAIRRVQRAPTVAPCWKAFSSDYLLSGCDADHVVDVHVRVATGAFPDGGYGRGVHPIALSPASRSSPVAAYYSLPPGWIGKLVKAQWDGLH